MGSGEGGSERGPDIGSRTVGSRASRRRAISSARPIHRPAWPGHPAGAEKQGACREVIERHCKLQIAQASVRWTVSTRPGRSAR